VRGLVPDQLDVDVAWALGAAFAEVIADPRGRGRRRRSRHAPSSPELSGPSPGSPSRRGRRHRDRAGEHRRSLLRQWALDLPGAMFTASHNPAAVQRHQAVPRRRPPGRSGHRSGRDPRPRPGTPRRPAGPPTARGQRHGPAGRARRLRPSCGPSSTCRAIRPLKVVVDAGNGMGGTHRARGPRHGCGAARRCRWRSSRSTSNSTAPSPTTRPTRSTRRTSSTCRRGRRARRRPRPGLRRRRRPLLRRRRARGAGEPERDHRAGRPARSARRSPGGRAPATCDRAQRHHLGRRAEIIAEQGAGRSAPGSGTPSSRPRWPSRAVFGGEHSAHYYFRDFWFADTGMLAAMHVLAALGEQDGPLSELMADYGRTRLGRDQLHRRRRAAATEKVRAWASAHGVTEDELDGMTRSPMPARGRADVVAQPAGRATPSRCCASTSRRDDVLDVRGESRLLIDEARRPE
jgi:phosphomannomutase